MFKIEFKVFHNDVAVFKRTFESSKIWPSWNNLNYAVLRELEYFDSLQKQDDLKVENKEVNYVGF